MQQVNALRSCRRRIVAPLVEKGHLTNGYCIALPYARGRLDLRRFMVVFEGLWPQRLIIRQEKLRLWQRDMAPVGRLRAQNHAFSHQI